MRYHRFKRCRLPEIFGSQLEGRLGRSGFLLRFAPRHRQKPQFIGVLWESNKWQAKSMRIAGLAFSARAQVGGEFLGRILNQNRLADSF
ncbi:hypothetical protein AVEN_188640-1 [Araneus ventricosus]|uniref:Uncharacterized protein n=1 Tax=Araneus ventricosus TaxID=182803 RepID=A0A4Y2RZ79_ARAVE|nr:hypothetical protein AVEN_188640-1 [Araneus ventricosus]